MDWVVLLLVIGVAVWITRARPPKPVGGNSGRRARAIQPPAVDRIAAGQAEVLRLEAAIQAADIDAVVVDAVWDECVRSITWSGSYWGMCKRLNQGDQERRFDFLDERLDLVHGRPSSFINSWAATLRQFGLTWPQLDVLAGAMPWASSDYQELVDTAEPGESRDWFRRMALVAPHREDAVLAVQAFSRAKWSPSDRSESQKYFARTIREPWMTQADLAALIREISDPSDETLFTAELWRIDAPARRALLATWDDEVDHCFVADGGGLVEVTRIGLLAGEAVYLGVDGCPPGLVSAVSPMRNKAAESGNG